VNLSEQSASVLTRLLAEQRETNRLLSLLLDRIASPITKAVRLEDRQVLELLPRISNSLGEVVITVGDLWRHAEREDPELCLALKAVFRQLDKQAARRAGFALRRLAGCSFGGFVLERVGLTRAGALWMVRRE
jgi:hypothetical protein